MQVDSTISMAHTDSFRQDALIANSTDHAFAGDVWAMGRKKKCTNTHGMLEARPRPELFELTCVTVRYLNIHDSASQSLHRRYWVTDDAISSVQKCTQPPKVYLVVTAGGSDGSIVFS